MPSGPKRRKAQKKKEAAAAAAAAALQKSENEAQPTAIAKENGPVVQTESTDGVTVVFDEPTVVFPKRTVLLKNFAPEFLDLKEKDAEDGIKEDALPTGMYSSVQSLDVAEPVDAAEDQKTLENKEDMSVEKIQSLVPSKNGVAVDNQEIAAPNEVDAPEKTEAVQLDEVVAVENVPNEVEAPEKIEETELVVVEAVVKNKAAILEDVDDIGKNTLEGGVEKQKTAAPDELDPPEKIEAVGLDEVEAAAKNKEAAILEDVLDIQKNTLKAVVEKLETAAPDEADAPEKTRMKNEEAAILGDVDDFEENTLEAVAEKKETVASTEVDAPEKAEEAVQLENTLVTPEVDKHLKEVKDMVEEVLNRLNALDALLHKN